MRRILMSLLTIAECGRVVPPVSPSVWVSSLGLSGHKRLASRLPGVQAQVGTALSAKAERAPSTKPVVKAGGRTDAGLGLIGNLGRTSDVGSVPPVEERLRFHDRSGASTSRLHSIQPLEVRHGVANPSIIPRRSALLGGALGLSHAASPQRKAEAFGPVTMPISDIEYEEVTCLPEKGEMLKGTKVTAGLQARCVKARGTVTNPNREVLKTAGVFGRINDKAATTSVLANALDGASDVGQFTLVDKIPPGKSEISFRFVAALPKNLAKEPLPELEFKSLKAIWYPGGDRFKPLSECEMNPFADGCD